MNARQDKGKEKTTPKRKRDEELDCSEELSDSESDVYWYDDEEAMAQQHLMNEHGGRMFLDDEAICSDDEDNVTVMDDGDEGPAPATQAPEVVEPPAKKFRLNARQLFLTYPQCSLEPEEVLTLLTEKLGTPEAYIVAQETHQVKEKKKNPNISALSVPKTNLFLGETQTNVSTERSGKNSFPMTNWSNGKNANNSERQSSKEMEELSTEILLM
jgi:hypothetical protein